MPTSAASNDFCCNNTKFVLITIYRNCWSVEACISSKKYRENVNMEKMSFTVWGRASRLRHVAARRRVLCLLMPRSTPPPPRPHGWFPSLNRARINTRRPRLRRGTLPPAAVCVPAYTAQHAATAATTRLISFTQQSACQHAPPATSPRHVAAPATPLWVVPMRWRTAS